MALEELSIAPIKLFSANVIPKRNSDTEQNVDMTQ